MRYLKTIERKVRTILAKNEDARNDDMVLYLVLCNACLAAMRRCKQEGLSRACERHAIRSYIFFLP